MAVFGDSVPREMYEDMKAQRDLARSDLLNERQRYGQLVENFVDMRRHQEGMSPAGFDASKLDPMNLMGPATQLAVEEMANGDPELRVYLRNQAYLLTQQRKGSVEDQDPGAIDEAVAELIRQGDTT